MIGHELPNPDRIHALLADRALQGLSAEEQLELRQLSAERSLEEETWQYERTVAALDEALGREERSRETVPLAVQFALQDQAMRWLAESKGTSAPATVSEIERPKPSRGLFRAGPWLLAAACLLLVVMSWTQLLPQPPNHEAMRATLLNTAGDVRTIEWADNDLGVTGDVVWSDAEQAGFMRFEGLDSNDPSLEQYQLWIFDAQRDERYPVDGGVFDIAPGAGSAIVPIEPSIAVSEATLFAITIEPPGGVVVSDRQRLILLGSAGE